MGRWDRERRRRSRSRSPRRSRSRSPTRRRRSRSPRESRVSKSERSSRNKDRSDKKREDRRKVEDIIGGEVNYENFDKDEQQRKTRSNYAGKEGKGREVAPKTKGLSILIMEIMIIMKTKVKKTPKKLRSRGLSKMRTMTTKKTIKLNNQWMT